ncbi:histidine kinase dimerization/phosphoacceptor domain-containing protein [Calothrix sp. FACHB-1219]|uniref:histidine kinase dimerization/phosphoacceptor domain-containing protein n=1 Tax=unclassified Calothrix TaxID=2619626 RepID=UPI001689E0B8|nr:MULTISPECIES: histidine kinase dimerization/phosphoacceptor domain-containing protein [unclassified Calothrix]MBD2204527.1 histidine kinase dimerization/phosphoacceptor domain-containing protein [Calothrix sp. FACHB-168]MBD2219325.1 histidine kinase dimerization/phosphoacceptor domain-containing protein [Calothrix sp. FACHB-1219]
MITVLLLIIGGCILVWQLQILYTSRCKNQELLVIQEKNHELIDVYKTLGQSIMALNIQLQAAQKLSHIDPKQSQQSVSQAYQLSSEVMQELRQILRKMDSECSQSTKFQISQQNSDILYIYPNKITPIATNKVSLKTSTLQNIKSKIL